MYIRLRGAYALLFLLLLLPIIIIAQKPAQQHSNPDTTEINTINKARINGLLIGGGLAYAGSMTGLYHLWFKNYPQSSFHFINDNHEWLQMDKAGHATSSYYIGLLGYEALRWAGFNNKKAAWYGGSMGFAYLTVIEILDGFSAGWGASSGDLIANSLGSAAFISQQLIWEEQRILMKWSFHMTGYAKYRPDLLGRSFAERALKDYNGQTIWLSANIRSFLKNERRFPGWLNIAFGYGAEGMIGANSNPAFHNDEPLPGFDRYRQFYISPDIDLTRIKTKSPLLNKTLKTFGFLKIPLPALEFSSKGVKFHPLYF